MTLAEARAHFPVLGTCTYLNSNATGAFPAGMEQVLQDYWASLRDWRDEVWEGWWPDLHAHADRLAGLLGAPAGSVVTDVNVSALLGRLGTCLDFSGARRRIVTTDLEFPTTAFIWKGFARYGAELCVVPSDGRRVDEARLEEAIDARTALVCVSHVSFGTGALLDLRRIADRAHQVGAWIATDAYGSVGTLPVDVRALDVDFLLGGSHKWLCGAPNCAFLYVRPELLGKLEPAATGWVAGADPLSFGPVETWDGSARRLAAGTPAVLPALLSRPGLELLLGVGLEAVRAHSLKCTQAVIDAADELGLEVITPRAPDQRGGIVSLSFPDDREVAHRLVAKGFVCNHRGALRVAPHFYNTLEEVDRFMGALAKELRA